MLFEKSMKFLAGGKLYDMIWYVICDDEYVDDYKYYKCFIWQGVGLITNETLLNFWKNFNSYEINDYW